MAPFLFRVICNFLQILNVILKYKIKMKKLLTIALLALGVSGFAQEYKVITTIESIVPMGLGRSRIIENTTDVDASKFTTERTDGKDSKQGKVKRKDAKVDNLKETKLLNFYSGFGINFQNVASNDAMIESKLSEMSKDGWVLFQVVSGVESNAGKDDGAGIFITRYIFKRG